jgi:SOS-response transcriptional repressor LexA
MWPDFTEGTLIIVDPAVAPNHRNYVLCHLHKENEIIFRRYIEERTEKLLRPINHAYKTIPLQKNDTIIGVIIQSRNKFIE